MNVLDLFSGIGGFSLGLERAGMRTVAFCEIEPFCRRVLAKHWPNVPCYEDVRTLTADRLKADGISVDVICGGFPCQDISVAGKGAGIGGERSGLWSEYARIIGEIRPRYVIVENVAVLLARGLDRVLGDLAALGFDAEWHCIPASAVGAPHRRDRLWIIAYACSERRRQEFRGAHGDEGAHGPQHLLIASGHGAVGDVADADEPRLERWLRASLQECASEWTLGPCNPSRPDWWRTEPDVGRVVARLSTRLDGGRLDGTDTRGGTGEILQALRDDVRQKDLQWPARGFGGLQEAKVLLDTLCEHQGKARTLGHISLASQEASRIVVRGVWFDGTTACSSCRQRSAEQRSQQHPDPVRLLSQLLACDCGSAWLDPSGTPSETSRVSRLRSLGNAVVPQIPEIICRAILAAEADGYDWNDDMSKSVAECYRVIRKRIAAGGPGCPAR